ncbi:hypothetical protein [Ruegeria sp.]|uniref:hypothetical protein n=1 Tax=Ruegeria sp. TaxID=1879320 RepID=UPI003C7EC9E4
MSTKVKFPELSEILLMTGLTINRVSTITRVSRNTLAAMRDGQRVSTSSVSKLLNGLENEEGIDVRDFRTTLQRRIAKPNQNKIASNGGSMMLAVDNTANGGSGRRTSASIAADLHARMKTCAELASELADAAADGDHDVNQDDPRHIFRFHKRLNADLEEIYLQFKQLLTQKHDDQI